MGDFAAEAILHAFVAALVVEALLRLWRVDDPGLKIRFRLLALAAPLILPPVFALVAPVRSEGWFQDRFGLFAGRRWSEVAVLGVPLHALWLGGFSLLGISLWLMDVVPFVRERLLRRADPLVEAGDPGGLLARRVERLAAAEKVPPPPVKVLDRPAPYLQCVGALKPTLYLSQGTLQALDERELLAGLAHELGHAARRDPLLNWVLMGARTLHFFNPVVHVVVRAVARDAERRADDLSAQITGDPLSLASGMIKLFRASQGRQALREPAWGPFMARARAAAVEERCRRLMKGGTPGGVAFASTRFWATAVGLAVLLYFVS